MAVEANTSDSEVNDKLRVLVVDDEKNIRMTLAVCLEQFGCEVTGVASADGALQSLSRQPFDLAFLDLRLGDASGLDLIPKFLAESPNLIIVVMTAYATIDSAVEAIKRGAGDYLPADVISAKGFINSALPARLSHQNPRLIRYKIL